MKKFPQLVETLQTLRVVHGFNPSLPERIVACLRHVRAERPRADLEISRKARVSHAHIFEEVSFFLIDNRILSNVRMFFFITDE